MKLPTEFLTVKETAAETAVKGMTRVGLEFPSFKHWEREYGRNRRSENLCSLILMRIIYLTSPGIVTVATVVDNKDRAGFTDT